MAKANQISIDIAPDKLVAIGKAIADIKTAADFLQSLTAKEKKALKHMAGKSADFVEKTLEIGKNNPKMVPAFTDLEEAARDFAGWKALRPHQTEISSISVQFEDTMAALGSDAYRAALDIYATIQLAAGRNVAGAKSLLDELSPFFEKTRQSDPPPSA